MSTEQMRFENDLKHPGYIVGEAKGMWGIIRDAAILPKWPKVIMWVRAAERPNSPDKYYLLFDLTGYSATAPTATLYEVDKGAKLDKTEWPNGDADFKLAFNPDHAFGFYLPCDRLGQNGKEKTWKTNSQILVD